MRTWGVGGPEGPATPETTWQRGPPAPAPQPEHADVASTWRKGLSQSDPSAWLPAPPALFTCLVLRPRSRASHLCPPSRLSAPQQHRHTPKQSILWFFATLRTRFGILCLWIDEESARVGRLSVSGGEFSRCSEDFCLLQWWDTLTMCKSHSAQWVKWFSIDVWCVLCGVLGCVEGGGKGFVAFRWPIWCFSGHVDICWCDLFF